MFDFGMDGYRPHWLNDRPAHVAAHGDRLQALVGRPLTRIWLVWDFHYGEWFCDCPVMLDFDGEQVEINHKKFDDLSITWNTIDPRRPIVWPGPDFELQWRDDLSPELQALLGQTVRDVELLKWAGNDNDMANGTTEVSFHFARDQLTIVNALDQNGLILGPPTSSPLLTVVANG